MGLWAPTDEPPAIQNLRTLVLIHRHRTLKPGSDDSSEQPPNYELVFIHGRPSKLEADEPLALHAYVTSGGRSRLHHLASAAPSHVEDCDMQANVHLDDFRQQIIGSHRSMIGAVSITDQTEYSLQELDDYVSTRGWPGNAWDHLSAVLEAIIDPTLTLIGEPVPVAANRGSTDAPPN